MRGEARKDAACSLLGLCDIPLLGGRKVPKRLERSPARSIESGSRCPYVRSICFDARAHEAGDLEEADALVLAMAIALLGALWLRRRRSTG
jgi:MYXO-CTERM domain-containing protein